MDFEWDDNKNAINIQKHGIDFRDAVQVFFDPRSMTREDIRRDYGECRYQIMGMSRHGVLLVVYTERHENTLRVISARKANRKERRLYDPNLT